MFDQIAREIQELVTQGIEEVTKLAGSFENAQNEEPWRSLYDIFNKIDSLSTLEEEELEDG